MSDIEERLFALEKCLEVEVEKRRDMEATPGVAACRHSSESAERSDATLRRLESLAESQADDARLTKIERRSAIVHVRSELMAALEERMAHMRNQFDGLKARIHGRIDKLDSGVSQLHSKVAVLESTMSRVDGKLDRIIGVLERSAPGDSN